jgi:excisionase family DNA binding protein
MESLLNIKDAARVLKVSEMSIRRWTNSGRLKCYRVGGKKERRFLMEDLEEILEEAQPFRHRPLGIGGQSVPYGSHVAHFYSGEEEALGVSVAYLLKGIKREEALLAVMPPDRVEKLIGCMAQKGCPVGTWLKSGRLIVSTGMDSPGITTKPLEICQRRPLSVRMSRVSIRHFFM